MWRFFLLFQEVLGLEITFGSCAGLFGARNEDIWESVLKRMPDVFIWLGDAIYADNMILPFYFVVPDEKSWKEKYQKAKNLPGYKELREKVRVLGVWDDHDYGANNQNRHFSQKKLSKKLFLEFLDEPKDSPRYQREGLYESYDFFEGKLKIRVILLDDRTFLDPFVEDGDTLGDVQWMWLEEQLGNGADLFLIMNGLQIFVEDRITVTEKWHEKSRVRLIQLLKKYPNTILVTGDVHHTEILEVTCGGFSLIEFTSSGLTHAVKTQYGPFAGAVVDFWYPFTFNLSPRFYSLNFGSIQVSENGKIVIRSLDQYGKEYFSHTVDLEQMKRKVEIGNYCFQSAAERRAWHWLSVFIVIYWPWVSFLLSGVIFCRKYSNSF
jgi:alkaline phosphatase D